MEKVLTDFYVKPYPGPHHVFADTTQPILPLDYYDNDDGFWTEYIQYKQQRMAEN